ncbi:BtrH N-terminal domain-containing protein [Gorillibacterium sp. sgz500922]|uniref:BtrH N-terminal domain-containing protein n=1 Tax=Gorillibacterium sp. sgz500922 TaxID=3446694 RepID=UPI003F677C9D
MEQHNRAAVARAGRVAEVPRYYQPYVNDCFNNAYGALLAHKGIEPALALADYLSFMFDPDSERIGVNFLNRASASFYFTEEELNSSMSYGYLPATSLYRDGDGGPALDERRFQIRMHTAAGPEIAHGRLKQRIDEGEPVIVVVNLFEMSYHRAYQRQHGVHAVVVTGYDEDRKTFSLFDKYAMSSSDFDGELPMEEVRAGRQTPSDTENPVDGRTVRPIEYLWMELHLHPDFRLEEGPAIRLVEGSCRRMRGEERVHGRICGFPAEAAFVGRLRERRSLPFDETERYRFRFYYNQALKTVARQRRRFSAFLEAAERHFGWPPQEETAEPLREAAMRWEIAANLALKLGLTGKTDLLEDMAEQLETARQAEEAAVVRLERLAEDRVRNGRDEGIRSNKEESL